MPLAKLKGATSVEKTLIQRSWEAALAFEEISNNYVLTDDDRIAEHCTTFGAQVLMTSSKVCNGTTQLISLASKLRCVTKVRNEDPDNAPSDSPNLVPIDKMPALLQRLSTYDQLIKGVNRDT